LNSGNTAGAERDASDVEFPTTPWRPTLLLTVDYQIHGNCGAVSVSGCKVAFSIYLVGAEVVRL
jgi:hypothetical protein